MKMWNRVTTIAAGGLSDGFKSYLNQEVSPDEHPGFLMKHHIARNLLSPFQDSALPFCGTFVSWAGGDYSPEDLTNLMSPVQGLSICSSDSPVTMESLSYNVDPGIIMVSGVYAVEDLPPAKRDDEFAAHSFTNNLDTPGGILNWCYSSFVEHAFQTDALGAVFSLCANSADLADKKMREIINLMTR